MSGILASAKSMEHGGYDLSDSSTGPSPEYAKYLAEVSYISGIRAQTEETLTRFIDLLIENSEAFTPEAKQEFSSRYTPEQLDDLTHRVARTRESPFLYATHDLGAVHDLAGVPEEILTYGSTRLARNLSRGERILPQTLLGDRIRSRGWAHEFFMKYLIKDLGMDSAIQGWRDVIFFGFADASDVFREGKYGKYESELARLVFTTRTGKGLHGVDITRTEIHPRLLRIILASKGFEGYVGIPVNGKRYSEGELNDNDFSYFSDLLEALYHTAGFRSGIVKLAQHIISNKGTFFAQAPDTDKSSLVAKNIAKLWKLRQRQLDEIDQTKEEPVILRFNRRQIAEHFRGKISILPIGDRPIGKIITAPYACAEWLIGAYSLSGEPIGGLKTEWRKLSDLHEVYWSGGVTPEKLFGQIDSGEVVLSSGAEQLCRLAYNPVDKRITTSPNASLNAKLLLHGLVAPLGPILDLPRIQRIPVKMSTEVDPRYYEELEILDLLLFFFGDKIIIRDSKDNAERKIRIETAKKVLEKNKHRVKGILFQ